MKEYKLPQELKNRLEKFLYKDLNIDSTGVETNELLDELEALKEVKTTKYDYENDYKAFNSAILNFFYDDYFRGEEGHDYTDEEVTMAVTKQDVDDCLEIMRGTLYKHFGINA